MPLAVQTATAALCVLSSSTGCFRRNLKKPWIAAVQDVLLVQPDNKFPKPRSFRNGTYAGLETISDSASSVYGLDRPSYSSASELDERRAYLFVAAGVAVRFRTGA